MPPTLAGGVCRALTLHAVSGWLSQWSGIVALAGLKTEGPSARLQYAQP